MKNLCFVTLLPLLFATACSQDPVQAGESKTEESSGGLAEGLGDVLSQTADTLSKKAGELIDKVADEASDIKDGAGAKKVRETLEPWIDQLAQLKGKLGEKMPDLSSLEKVLDDLRKNPDESVQKTLKPLIAKLEKLVK